jgi:IclR family transcriptional regulator, KDG regulon repressor
MTMQIAPKDPIAARVPGDKTLTKGLQLLEALSQCEEPRGISELAHQLSLTKSNVHRLLQTLSRCGYVTQEASTERYLLSAKLWQVSHRTKPFDALQRLARPILRHIVEQTNESVIFAIVEQDDLIVIDQVETPNPVRVVFFSAGQTFPIDRVIMLGKGLTALQLIALAARPEAEARAVLHKLQGQLKKGKSFLDVQLSHISATRRSGFAVNRGEWVAGATAVAVPVFGDARNLIGMLSCFGPADRFTETGMGKVRKILSLGADDLSLRLHKS